MRVTMAETQEQPQEKKGGLGGIPAPLMMIGSLFIGLMLFFPNLLQGLFGMLGNLFGGMMNGGANAQTPDNTQSNGQGNGQSAPAQPQNFLTSLMNMFAGQGKGGGAAPTESAAPAAPSTVPVTLQPNAAGGATFKSNPKEAQWCSVDASGKPVAGNRIHELGDTASTTKMLAAYLVASDTKLPKGFAGSEPAKEYIRKMASDSCNTSSDDLLKLVAQKTGRSVDQVIGDYNKRLDAMGFKHAELANFSGLPTAGDGGLFVAPFRNVSTAYESAVLTQKFGSEQSAIAELFSPKTNHTGLGGVNAQCVKSGTAFGVINTGNGADKAATAYNGASGSVAVIESTRAQWIPTIEAALNTLKGRGGLPVTTPSAVMPPLPALGQSTAAAPAR
jgi:hypothetical protein